MTQYNWQKDDDLDWDRPEATDEKPPRRPFSRWLPPLLILALLSGIGYLIYYQLQGRVDETTARLAEDVISSYDLIERAARANDREIFISVLSGADDDWTNAQVNLLEQANLYDRRAFGLTWLGTAQPVTPTAVLMDEDLLGAELTATARYAARQIDGSTTEIELLLPQVYRLSSQSRWLLAPPLEEYWGETRTYSGQFIEIQYPARDEQYAELLGQAVNDALLTVCATSPTLACDADAPYIINLSTRPSAIESATGLSMLINGDNAIRLPTPSLVGLPTDAAAEQVLLRGYTRLILMGFLAERLGYDCCRRAIFLQAAADYLLAEQGLLAYPQPVAEYEELLNQLYDIRFTGDRPVGSVDLYLEDGQWPYAYGLVEFIFSERVSGEPAVLLHAMLETDVDTGWLQEALGTVGSGTGALDQAWYRFLATKVATPRTAINWPTGQEPQLYCRESDAVGLRRYRLDPVSGQLALIEPDEIPLRQPLLAPLPSGDGVILQRGNDTDVEQGEFLIRYFDGRELKLELPSEEIVQAYYVGRSSPDHQQLLFFFVTGPFSPDTAFGIYDLANCPDEVCRSTAVAYGSWSTDSQLYSYLDTSSTEKSVYIVTNNETDDEIRIEEVGDGYGTTPIWVDEETIVFFLGNDLIRYGVASGVRERLASLDDLLDSGLLGPLSDFQQIVATELVAVPGTRDRFIIRGQLVGAINSEESFIVRYDGPTQQFSLVLEPNSSRALPLDAGANGQWLTIYDFSLMAQNENTVGIYLYHYPTLQLFTYNGQPSSTFFLQQVPTFGDWILLSGQEFVRLINPVTDEAGYFFPDDGLSCPLGFWAVP